MDCSPPHTLNSDVESNKKLSSVLRELQDNRSTHISLNDLISSLGDRSFVPLMVIFALPNLFFFVPGASFITGPPLIFVVAQLAFGRASVWLPKALSARSIDHQTFKSIVGRTISWIEWVERLARPRYWPLSQKAADRTVGLLTLIMAIFMFLPIPFANALPALSVILLALSLSARDGLWLLAGLAAGLSSIAVTVAIFAAGALTMRNFV